MNNKIDDKSVQNFLVSQLKVGESTVGLAGEDAQSIEDRIYSRLTSKKFRKYKMDDACAVRTKQAISSKVSAQRPLKIIFPQGGYKLWRFPTSPSADWAEYFNISYVIEYLLPIAHSYKPGVELVYYMHTLLMELHDNLTTQEIQEYVDSFQALINEFTKYLPKNFTISILRDADIYSREDYFSHLEEGKAEAEKTYQGLPVEKKADLKRMAELNIKWEGKEDWTKLSESEREEKLYLAALYEMAAGANLKKVMETVKSPENVLLFTKPTKEFIGIGSTKTSLAKYWVGFGVLETSSGGELLPRVLTPSQYLQAIREKHDTVSVEVIEGINFREILVFDTKFDFKKLK